MKIVLALLFILSLNTMLFFGQTAVNDIRETDDPTAPKISFFNEQGSLIDDFAVGEGENRTVPQNVTNWLPSGTGSISATTGNFFTDLWSTVRNWMFEKTGLSYVARYVNALPNFLSVIGLPAEFVWGLGALWYAISLFLLITWLKGGST